MSITCWAEMHFSRELTADESGAFQRWLEARYNDGEVFTYGRYELDALGVDRRFAVVGWVHYDDLIDLLREMVERTALPLDVTVKAEVDYRDCDEPGKELTYYGPTAIAWERDDLIRDRDALQLRIDRLTNALKGKA